MSFDKMGRASKARGEKETKWGVTNLFEKTATDTPMRTNGKTRRGLGAGEGSLSNMCSPQSINPVENVWFPLNSRITQLQKRELNMGGWKRPDGELPTNSAVRIEIQNKTRFESSVETSGENTN